ncbi:hypothetical protein [Roseicella sp. DB1501]|uniref:beta strand repeat-containing protein n=1 Tax=Roseicella sp. DB1501 TaxID=2730925 RepID=UPI001492C3DB|nr:hypothetical protein [Roseicella sp. DB1501]NOG70505.1 hypothetical protein [Roseicella sp. DB1501]
MKRISVLFLALVLLSNQAFAALSPSNIYTIQSTATVGNANGGGFNTANPNFLTDGAITSATGSSPVLTSASYSFTSADVGASIWLPAQTNVISGFFKIASVNAGAATLSAGIGAGSIVGQGRYLVATTAGVGTAASLTGITFGVDYSQMDTSPFADTDIASSNGSTAPAQVTSASHPFTVAMVGNLLRVTAGTGFTASWYEIVSVSGGVATLDRAVGTTATLSNGTGKVGGALSLGSSDANVFNSTLAVASSTGSAMYFIKGGATYTLSGTVTIASGNALSPIKIEGFSSVRGDRPSVASGTLPVLNPSTATLTLGNNTVTRSVKVIGSAASVINFGNSASLLDSSVYNNSTTAGRSGITTNFNSLIRNVEAVSIKGKAVQVSTSNNAFSIIEDSYLHDSDIGISVGGNSSVVILGNLIIGNVTGGIIGSLANTGFLDIRNNTIYGAENKLGTGISLVTGSLNQLQFRNNILYGLATGASGADVNNFIQDNLNDYFNNTADVNDPTKWQKGNSDLALDPQFAGVAQISGTTATTVTGNHFVQAGATFLSSGVTPGRDFLYVISGTGVTVGKYGIASVDSETQITTDIAIAADSTPDKVWQITTGKNFAIGTNLKAKGAPGNFPGGYTTGFIDIGAVQRQEGGGTTILGSCSSVY